MMAGQAMKLVLLVVLLAASLILTSKFVPLNERFDSLKAMDFYYFYSTGSCPAGVEVKDCNGYPLGTMSFAPLALFGLGNFHFLVTFLVLFLPAALFLLLFDNFPLALVYVVSPIALTTVSYGLLGQFLVMAAFMLMAAFPEERVVNFAIVVSPFLHRFAIVLFGLFGLLGFRRFDVRPFRPYAFIIAFLLAGAILLLSASSLESRLQLPLFSLLQTSVFSLAMFTVPIVLLAVAYVDDERHIFLMLLLLCAAAAIATLNHFDVGLHSDFLGRMGASLPRMIELGGFVALVGLAASEKRNGASPLTKPVCYLNVFLFVLFYLRLLW